MVLHGARIYNEGLGIGHDCEDKIRQIVNTIKTYSPNSDISFRFLKNGRTYEGLMWGKANDMPIGVYRRGPSLIHVLDTLFNQAKKDCLKTWRSKGLGVTGSKKANVHEQPELAMAG